KAQEEPAAPAEPAPAPATEQPPVEPAPVYAAPAAQPPAVQEPLYAQEEPQRAAPATAKRKVDTLEFAIAPHPAEEPDEAAVAEAAPQPQEELPVQPGAGPYDEPPAEKPARKTARKSSTGKRSTRKPKAAAEPQEELSSPAFDNFEGVDFDS